MMNECYRVFRSYCGFSLEHISKVTGVTVERLKLIELGTVVPTEDEERKIAALYNLSPENMRGSINSVCDTVVRQPFDLTLYETELEREMVKADITALSDIERMMITVFRSIEDKKTAYESFVKMTENMDKV